jgi:hypothetical protein
VGFSLKLMIRDLRPRVAPQKYGLLRERTTFLIVESGAKGIRPQKIRLKTNI